MIERSTVVPLPLAGISGVHNAPAGAAERVVNMRRTARGTWETSGGYTAAITGDQSGYGYVDSIHWWSKHSGGQQWVACDFGGDTAGSTASFGYLDFRSGTI